MLLSNLYLHYVPGLWFERVVKVRLRGEARLVRYIDDFVICFQYREDALRVEDALRHRLGKFGLTLEPSKTKLAEFGRFAQRHAGKHGRNRPETIYCLGLTLYCTRNRKGNFKVGMRTEKSWLRRSLASLRELMRRIRHYAISEQERLPMRNIRDVLRLAAGGMPDRQIAASLSVSKTTVRDCLQRPGTAGLAWPLPDDLTGAVLEARLYPPPVSAPQENLRSPIGRRYIAS